MKGRLHRLDHIQYPIIPVLLGKAYYIVSRSVVYVGKSIYQSFNIISYFLSNIISFAYIHCSGSTIPKVKRGILLIHPFLIPVQDQRKDISLASWVFRISLHSNLPARRWVA